MILFRQIYGYREMLKNLVVRDLRTRYKESVLGFLWTLINPLLMLLIYSIVFKTIMRMDIENYSIFLFAGLLPWQYHQTVVSSNTSIIINNNGLIKKVYFPAEILPLSSTIAGAINFLLSLLVLLVSMIVVGVPFSLNIIFLPLLLFLQMIFIFGLSLILSSLNVFFRDLEHIVGILMMAWFYMTPVFYPLSMVPEKFQAIFALNPMTPLEQAYRQIFYYGKPPEMHTLGSFFVYSVIFLIVGLLLFNNLKKKFAEEL
ncbi:MULTISPECIES: ABC transporter permease [unclassified Paenibacillus]|uniref:ABC transporter permease n=1 Tax=unclassified Paenibacillus TaxID=185978 RepID=UPI0024049FB2|nr:MULTISPECIES: ABC transporter permease [unclassified Paenibacillus]MDF9840209.1 lipopolysaccharide transport system permease protein [Paenibacillus sp. PastF-2]MDF9846791.1 lipopolysaccharide transport system permease protein [Paenibacillus sp. PastM-2]MDF9852860.1 lipopolysaccharide transport system permease protein [Paenibacillus sp. PastF-1]MDH6478635.1 lipopolysaccharide transport system permease protein [Paenibacillus sp. PastH-2]MDH6505867.1 lipopolysaccharide transport system permeas